jgi:hypothetical protein
MLNKPLRHEDVWGSGYIDPCFLDLGTSWRKVGSFALRPFYPRGHSPAVLSQGKYPPQYPFYSRLGGPVFPFNNSCYYVKKYGKTVAVTGHGGP